MNTVNKEELFQHLTDFLKSKGIELKEGTYTHRVRWGCDLLADAVNTTQKTVTRAKAEVDRKLDQLRQSIHEATAPKPPRRKPRSAATAANPEAKKSSRAKSSSGRAAKASGRRR